MGFHSIITADKTDPALDENNAVTHALSRWATNLAVSDIPQSILERAKHIILDGIACGFVGAHVPWSEQMAEAVSDYEPNGYCSLIGYEKSFGPLAAAMLNSSFIQAVELDDYHSMAPWHSASVLLPALLAAAQVKSKTDATCTSGNDLLVATVVGLEAGPRVGLAMGGGQLLVRGWHSGPVFGSPAAAIACSKLLCLNADKTESAIGIACTQAGGLMAAQYEGTIKRAQHAFAARNGLSGALLARNGYGGIKKVMERSYGGFLSMFSGHENGHGNPKYDVRRVMEGLGDTWETSSVRIKLHACVGACHGQIEALEKLQMAHPARFACKLDILSRISRITVHLSSPAFAHDGWVPEERPLTTTGAQMNAAYIGAVQLVDGQVLLSQFAPDSLDRDVVWDLVHKTTCLPSPEFDKPHHGCGARVVVEFADGVVLEETVAMPKGFDPPITNEEIRVKYRRLLASAVDDVHRIDRIEKLVLGLEHLDDVSELLALLAMPTNRVLG